MKLTAYPAASVVSPAYYRNRASTMIDTFIAAIRGSVKIEQATAIAQSARSLDFTRMATGLQGSEAALNAKAKKEADALIAEKHGVN